MKKFLKGFVRNFFVLLLLFTGIKMWREQIWWASILCFLALLVLLLFAYREIKKRQRENQKSE